MARLDEIEARIATLETQRMDLDRMRQKMEEAYEQFHAKAIANNCDLAAEAIGFVTAMHREVDSTLRQHLGVGFEVSAIRKKEREGWKP